MEIGDICFLYIYIYKYILYMRPHLVARALHNMGRVKCQPLLKNSNYWKLAVTTTFKEECALVTVEYSAP